MLHSGLLPHTVTLYPSVETTDERGNPIRVPGGNGIESEAYLQPVDTAEDLSSGPGGGQAASELWVAYLPAVAPRLDAHSQLICDGVTFETVGAALPFDTPAGRHHWRVRLRRLEA